MVQQRKGDARGDSKGQQFPSPASVLSDAEKRMKGAEEALRREMAGLRTGRASAALVEHVTVDYYGTPTPLSQMASISVPEARLIIIQPWDRQAIPSIEKALLKSELGVTPANDGQVVRVPIPPLTEERRRDLVKVLRKKVEDAKIAVRNVRRDAVDVFREMERAKTISQDEARRYQEQVQKLTDRSIAEMDKAAAQKEAEIMQV